jgi:predicted SprT family Zn-dependent metalloprotease
MNLLDAQRLANALMVKHDLIIKGWRFEFDNAKKRFGACHYGTKRITLSKVLVELNSEVEVKDTILHEIAHALVGYRHGHNSIWRQKALEIGCNGNRCYSSKEVVTPKLKYQAVCGGCGKTYQKSRMTAKALRCKSACRCQSNISWDNKILLEFKEH